MTNGWLPPWLGWAWVVALAVVALVHVRHLVRLPDVTRWWHLGHVTMALGMIAMFWPSGLLLEPPSGVIGRVVFALAAVAALSWGVVDRARRGRWTLVWPLLALDMAAMVWMFVTMAPLGEATGAMAAGSMSMGPAGVHAVIGAWFVLETLGWASGWLVRASEHDLHLELPVAGGGEAVPALSGTGTSPGSSTARGREATQPSAGTPDAEPAQAAGRARTHQRAGSAWHGRSLRVTLTLMSASMAFMLLAMAFGPAGEPTGPGMTEMDGMTDMAGKGHVASMESGSGG